MRAISGLFLILTTFQAFGSSDHTASAEKLCQSLVFSSDKLECIKLVNKGHFYSDGAIGMCATMLHNSDKLKCIETVRNKEYSDTNLQTCKSMNFSSEQLKCLSESGEKTKKVAEKKAKKAEKSKNRHSKKVRQAIKKIDQGKPRQAKNILVELLSDME